MYLKSLIVQGARLHCSNLQGSPTKIWCTCIAFMEIHLEMARTILVYLMHMCVEKFLRSTRRRQGQSGFDCDLCWRCCFVFWLFFCVFGFLHLVFVFCFLVFGCLCLVFGVWCLVRPTLVSIPRCSSLVRPQPSDAVRKIWGTISWHHQAGAHMVWYGGVGL